MKTKITSLLTSVIGAFLFCGCDTDVEPLENPEAAKLTMNNIFRIYASLRRQTMR